MAYSENRECWCIECGKHSEARSEAGKIRMSGNQIIRDPDSCVKFLWTVVGRTGGF